MLQNIKTLHGKKLAATDGDIGHVSDFYFDDTTWAIRYLVANTGNWLTGRLVLISPHSLGLPDADSATLPVHLTREQIENSPPIDTDKPVSRQYEFDYYHYYGWPAYWDGGGAWGLGATSPALLPFTPGERAVQIRSQTNNDPHLRSVQAVTGYSLQATDGELGSVRSFQVDDKTWIIGELVAETGPWYSGKEILIPTDCVTHISYEESKIFVNLTKADLQSTAENEVAEAGGPHSTSLAL
jgi:hypothetical protein